MDTGRADHFVHEALFYGAGDELVAEAVPFLRAALAGGEDAVLVCTEENNAAVAAALGNDDRIIHLPRSEVYDKAVTAIDFFRDFLCSRQEAGSKRVRVVAQVNFGTDLQTWEDWRAYEAAVNQALAPFPLWSICAYDTTVLPDPLIATGELTHPYLRRHKRTEPNPLYVDPAELLRLSGANLQPLSEPASAIAITDEAELRPLHRGVRRILEGARIDRDKITDVLLSVNEIATNGLLHGLPPVTVRLWLSPGRVVCTVTDQGPGFDQPLRGYVRGDPLPEGRFGLWLARRLCDEVVAAATPEGFTIRLVVRH